MSPTFGMRSGTHMGWFGRYEFRGQKSAKHHASVVHVVENGVPACGVKPHPDSEFQWCASGLHADLLECGQCKRTLRRRARLMTAFRRSR